MCLLHKDLLQVDKICVVVFAHVESRGVWIFLRLRMPHENLRGEKEKVKKIRIYCQFISDCSGIPLCTGQKLAFNVPACNCLPSALFQSDSRVINSLESHPPRNQACTACWHLAEIKENSR